jgi:hypothetical protein
VLEEHEVARLDGRREVHDPQVSPWKSWTRTGASSMADRCTFSES